MVFGFFIGWLSNFSFDEMNRSLVICLNMMGGSLCDVECLEGIVGRCNSKEYPVKFCDRVLESAG